MKTTYPLSQIKSDYCFLYKFFPGEKIDKLKMKITDNFRKRKKLINITNNDIISTGISNSTSTSTSSSTSTLLLVLVLLIVRVLVLVLVLILVIEVVVGSSSW